MFLCTTFHMHRLQRQTHTQVSLLFFLSNYWYIDDLSIGEVYLGKVLYSGLNMVFSWSAGRVSSSLAALLLLVLMIY